MKSRHQLTNHQIAELTSQAKQTKDLKEARRIQALLLFHEGENWDRIKRFTFLSRSQVFSLREKYSKAGLPALASKPKPVKRLLTSKQLEEIKDLLTHKNPSDVGYEGVGWTTNMLAYYIK